MCRPAPNLVQDGGESVVRGMPASPDARLWEAARSRVEVRHRRRRRREHAAVLNRVERGEKTEALLAPLLVPSSCSGTFCSGATASRRRAPGSLMCAWPSNSSPYSTTRTAQEDTSTRTGWDRTAASAAAPATLRTAPCGSAAPCTTQQASSRLRGVLQRAARGGRHACRLGTSLFTP